MTERTGWYDIALFVGGKCPIEVFAKILDDLSDNDIDVDYATLEFHPDGAYMDVKFSKDIGEGIEDIIDRIKGTHGYISIDYGTMMEWDPCISEEEDM